LDICAAIEQVAALPECSGAVGMTGISWSGFNSLQVAARRPPALKAIITVCSTDDRYDNDVHYMGGSLLGFYMGWWGAIVHEFNLRPPDPAVVGEDWLPMHLQRCSFNPYLTDQWLSHQRRDDYWRIGSVCEDYSAVQCPVLAVGGWADGYTDAILRLLDNTPVTKAIIGPWGHTWPERSVPGPSIGFLQECVRWWDCHLKGIDNDCEQDPRVRYYLQEPCALEPSLSYRPGSWMQAAALEDGPSWSMGFHAAACSAGGRACEDAVASHKTPLECGTQVDTWLPMGSNIDLPQEQSPDDQRSLCFDSPVLEEELAIAGRPLVQLSVASDQPEAFAFCRLCDVYPDGSSQLITRGCLNLTHRGSHEFPEALTPGEFYAVEVPLKAVAQRVPAGHKLRVAISSSYWPWIWPSKVNPVLSVERASSALVVPLAGEGHCPLQRAWEQPQVALGERPAVVPNAGFACERSFDSQTGVLSYTRWTDDYQSMTTPGGMTVRTHKEATYSIEPSDPLSAALTTQRHECFSRPGWEVRIAVDASMECDAEDFILKSESAVVVNGKQTVREVRESRVARDFN
ncbi:MAG: CocE/NonD family hydrolase, partial [Coriobacteriales bacterium]